MAVTLPLTLAIPDAPRGSISKFGWLCFIRPHCCHQPYFQKLRLLSLWRSVSILPDLYWILFIDKGCSYLHFSLLQCWKQQTEMRQKRSTWRLHRNLTMCSCLSETVLTPEGDYFQCIYEGFVAAIMCRLKQKKTKKQPIAPPAGYELHYHVKFTRECHKWSMLRF